MKRGKSPEYWLKKFPEAEDIINAVLLTAYKAEIDIFHIAKDSLDQHEWEVGFEIRVTGSAWSGVMAKVYEGVCDRAGELVNELHHTKLLRSKTHREGRSIMFFRYKETK